MSEIQGQDQSALAAAGNIASAATSRIIRGAAATVIKRSILRPLLKAATIAAVAVATAIVVEAITKTERDVGENILVHGGNIMGHAEHILDAQTGRGSNQKPISATLNHTPRSAVNYNVTGFCNDAARTEAKARFGGGVACDEYPFASTRQGGQANYDRGDVSLRLLPIEESEDQRDLLRDFYNLCDVSSDGVSSTSEFVAIAIPSQDVPSGFFCRNGAFHVR